MTRASLAGRIAAIEAARRLAVTGGGALSQAERAELDQLLAAARPDIDTMTGAEADEWLYRHSIDGDDGSGDRLDDLRRRARTPGQVAKDLAHERRMAGMNSAERNAWAVDYLADCDP